MYNNDEFIKIIKGRLSEKRFQHSMNVAASAKALAKKFGADEEKAYTAGILHDIMKEKGEYSYPLRHHKVFDIRFLGQ